MPAYRTSGIEKESPEAFLEINSNNSVKVSLGDAAGGNTFQVDNTTPASVFSVDSDGDAEVLNDLTVGGDLIVTGVQKALITIYAEENGTLSNNSDEWSFGANDTGNDRAVYLRYPGRILAVALACENDPSSTTNVECRIEEEDGTLEDSASVSLTSGNNRGKNDLTTPVEFSADRYVRFRTVLGGGASGAVVSALIQLDMS